MTAAPETAGGPHHSGDVHDERDERTAEAGGGRQRHATDAGHPHDVGCAEDAGWNGAVETQSGGGRVHQQKHDE